jgi:hypothetical protein
MATAAASDATAPAAQQALVQVQGHPPLIHLGKVKKKQAKKLKKSQGGELSAEISQSYQQMQLGLGANQQPIIISYEEKPGKKKNKKKKKIKFLGMTIDRKKLKKRMRKSGFSAKLL